VHCAFIAIGAPGDENSVKKGEKCVNLLLSILKGLNELNLVVEYDLRGFYSFSLRVKKLDDSDCVLIVCSLYMRIWTWRGCLEPCNAHLVCLKEPAGNLHSLDLYS